jgi:hypothetical protein
MRRRLALSLAAAALAGGCGDSGGEPPSALCTEGEATIEHALGSAPGRVVLADGTRLSDCVARARDAGELQSFGVIVTRIGDRLADTSRSDPRAALRLGYLIGAARRGAAHSQGIHAELVHRLEVTARRVPDGAQAQVQRGVRAGERDG